MAEPLQAGHHLLGHRLLHQQRIALEEHARGIERSLRVHTIIEHVAHDVDVAHGLEVGAHDAEGHVGLAFLQHHGRHQRVQGAFAWRDAVGMPRIGDEALAAVVQDDASLGRDDAGAELVEQRVDERHRHALLVDDGEIHRVGAGGLR